MSGQWADTDATAAEVAAVAEAAKAVGESGVPWGPFARLPGKTIKAVRANPLNESGLGAHMVTMEFEGGATLEFVIDGPPSMRLIDPADVWGHTWWPAVPEGTRAPEPLVLAALKHHRSKNTAMTPAEVLAATDAIWSAWEAWR